MQDFDPHFNSVLIDEKAIQNRVRELGAEISAQYPDGVILVGILTGALYFLVDLSRAISCPIEIDLIAISSYIGTNSSGTVTFTKDLSCEIDNRHVLVVEDIVDTGRTNLCTSRIITGQKPTEPRYLHPPGQTGPQDCTHSHPLLRFHHSRPICGGLWP